MASSPSRESEVQRILSILHKWGIHTVGAFARLDKEHLSLRLGPEAVRLWERANGKSIRLLKLIEPPEPFEESFEFEHEIETSEPLLFILRRFLQQLSARLTAIYQVAEQLGLRIAFSSREHYERCFKIPQPTNDVDLLFRMLQTHLENFKSEHPIVAVALEARPVKPASRQFGLFETALRNPAQLSETLARLVALLGENRIGTPVLEETHRPDAFRMEPFKWQTNNDALILTLTRVSPPARSTGSVHVARIPAASFSPREKGLEGNRDAVLRLSRWERWTLSAGEGKVRLKSGVALRRFRPNIHSSVLLERAQPVHVRSTKVTGDAVDRRGPWFASGNWWNEQNWSRREWDLKLTNGAVLRCHHDGKRWQIDGIYD